MAGSATYTAVLDACVLYSAPLRDVLLSLASAGLFHARWTPDIQDEWTRNLLVKRPDLNLVQLQFTQERMIAAIPDCMVTHYQPLIAGLSLPDPDDRHVLAAAIAGHADAIVTVNLKDFPPAILATYSLEAQHPDDFVMNQLELREQPTALTGRVCRHPRTTAGRPHHIRAEPAKPFVVSTSNRELANMFANTTISTLNSTSIRSWQTSSSLKPRQAFRN